MLIAADVIFALALLAVTSGHDERADPSESLVQ